MRQDPIAVVAAKGVDTEDWLQHIAWTDVVKPQLLEAKRLLTGRLVGLVLHDVSGVPSDSTEKVAGKIFGIDFVINEVEKIVSRGREAQQVMGASSHDPS